MIFTGPLLNGDDRRINCGSMRRPIDGSNQRDLKGQACLDLKSSGRHEVRTTKGRKKVVKGDLIRNIDSREA
jgi:hypothetical protein